MSRKKKAYESAFITVVFFIIMLVIIGIGFARADSGAIFVSSALGIAFGYFIKRTAVLWREYKKLGDL